MLFKSFRTIVPLNKIAIGKVGPGVSTTDQDEIPVKLQVRTQVKTQDAILSVFRVQKLKSRSIVDIKMRKVLPKIIYALF